MVGKGKGVKQKLEGNGRKKQGKTLDTRNFIKQILME